MINNIKKYIIKSLFFWIPFTKLRKTIRFNLYKKFNIRYSASPTYPTSNFYYKNPKTFPEATGYLRDIQNCQVKILKEVHRICEKFNIKYWLSFGNLLGSARNGKFIPWDDDIDISMLRNDYKKFVEIFNKNTNIKKLYAYYKKSGLIKIQLKDTNITLDIFSCDIIHKKMNLSEKINFSNKIIKEAYTKNIRPKKNGTEYNDCFEKYTLKTLLKNDKTSQTKNSTIFYSLDFSHNWGCLAFDYETIFPLKKVKFENFEFYAPKDIDTYLTCIYGDYLSIPTFTHYHTDINKLTLEEIFTIKEFNKK